MTCCNLPLYMHSVCKQIGKDFYVRKGQYLATRESDTKWEGRRPKFYETQFNGKINQIKGIEIASEFKYHLFPDIIVSESLLTSARDLFLEMFEYVVPKEGHYIFNGTIRCNIEYFGVRDYWYELEEYWVVKKKYTGFVQEIFTRVYKIDFLPLYGQGILDTILERLDKIEKILGIV